MREPHRVLFALGAVLAAAGVLPWIAFALGLERIYQPIFFAIGFRSLFHPVVEVQAALGCFAAGAIFARWRPAGWQVAAAVVAPIAVAVAAALDRWAIAQLAWGTEAVMLIAFALRRGSGRASPAVIAWVPAGLLLGAAGGVLASLGEARGGDLFWLYDLGRALVWQGLFAPLVLGCAGYITTLQCSDVARPLRIAGHALCALIFAASFPIEARSPRIGYALRALACALPLLPPLRELAGGDGSRLQRKLAQIAPHLLPLGFALVAIDPGWRRIGLHVVYLGSFASLAFALVVAALPHAPVAAALKRLDTLLVALVLLAMSLAARVLLEADPANFRFWLGTAAICFAALGLIWMRLSSSSAGPRTS